MANVITGKPIWQTPAGDLGTIQEGEFYQLTLYAYDDITNTSKYLYYIMVAGELPEGIQCRRNGLIEGIPKAVTSLQGVPLEVKENVTSKFTVRVFTAHDEIDPATGGTVEVVDRVADRTFTITVAGADVPEWVTQPSDVKDCYDGDYIEYQFKFTDPDPGEEHTFRVINGKLPPGVTLTKDGLLSGVVQPAQDLPNTAAVGYDAVGSNFDQYAFDHATQSSSANYDFTVELSDGRNSSIQNFNIYVYSKDNLTADITDITVDNTDVTADVDNTRVPYLTTKAGDLGTYRHDNYFAYQFEGVDVDGDPLEYALTTGDPAAFDADGVGFDATGIGFDRADTKLPPGLTMDIDTGFLYGYIPDVGLTDTTYTFGVQVKKKLPGAVEWRGGQSYPEGTIVRANGQYYKVINSDYSSLLTEEGDPFDPSLVDNTSWNDLIDDDNNPDTSPVERITVSGESINDPMYELVNPEDYAIWKSEISFFTMRIIGAIDTDITWITPTRVATVYNGDISHATIKATASSGSPLQYRLKEGSKSRLPQGLTLQPSGNITGQTSFQAFMLDGGTTTFDEEITTRLVVDPTVFDRTYYFTVEAFNESSRISVFKEFEIYIDLKYLEPYETVYMSATPELSDRADILELLDNKDIFPEDLIYRSDDPNFGISRKVRYNHAFGIKSRELEEYVEAMKLNHYRKNLVLGDIKTAQAVDIDGNVIYEVVYSEVQQKLKNKEESVALEVARTPFFEDYQAESIIDYSKTASTTTVTADRTDVTTDADVEPVFKYTADNLEETADGTFITADYGQTGTLIKLTADLDTIKADSTHYSADATEYYDYRNQVEDLSRLNYVYPNSLDNMRKRIIDRLGQYAEILPEWMKSKQSDGRVLGFTPAWVIAYAKPGKSDQLRYYIDNLYTKTLNSVDFETDRYSVDRSMIQNWDTTNGRWLTGRETTFNKYIKSRELNRLAIIDLATELGFSDIHNRTVDYVAQLGGIDGRKFANQLDGKKVVFVNQEDFDDIDEAFTRYNRDAEDTRELIPGTEQARDDSTINNERIAIYKITVNPITENITLSLDTQADALDYVEVLDGTKYGSATLFVPRAPAPGLRYVNWQYATFDISVNQTLFDGGSLRFISNKDKTINDDRLDKYVMYPQHTIIGNQDYIKL